jgi:hypothetical protein
MRVSVLSARSIAVLDINKRALLLTNKSESDSILVSSGEVL